MSEPPSETTATAGWSLDDTDAPPTLPERWRLLASLGSGGQAAVWLAEDQLLEQQVALKVFRGAADPDSQRRRTREVRLGRELSHPHLIRLYDLVEVGDSTVAVMEWAAGGPLSRRLALEGPQPVAAVVRWLRQALDALAFLHQRRIVHRDVKPSNMLLDEAEDLKLADFGLMRQLDRPSDLTRTGVGTPSYMAPEQLRGGEPAPSWDLYALGVSCYQLLTGVRPFAGDSEFDTADSHLHRRPRPVRARRSDCPRWLARLVERLLAKRPEDRWPSAREALAALDRRRAGIAPGVVRRRLARTAGVAAVLAVAAAGAHMMRAPHGDIAVVDVVGDRVVARNDDGEVLWRRRFDGLQPTVLLGEMSPIPGREAVILASPPSLAVPPARSVLEMVTAPGDTIRREELGAAAELSFPEVSPIWQASLPHLADLDGDGYDEVLFALIHPLWYPTVLTVRGSDPGHDFNLPHAGRISDLLAADLDGDGVREIVVVAFNNPLGFQNAVAIVSQTNRVTGQRCDGVLPPSLAAAKDGRPAGDPGCLSYTVLGARWGFPKLEVRPPQLIVVGEGEERVELDRWGNPVGSALEGVGPEPRHRFWTDVAGASGRLRLVPGASWRSELATLRQRDRAVAAEPPSLAAAALLLAQATAEGGDRLGAVALLEGVAGEAGDELDLWLRAGEQRLMLGDRRRGRELVRRSLPVARHGRTCFDQVLVLLLDAVVFGDADDLAEVTDLIESLGLDRGAFLEPAVSVSRDFFHGEFDSRSLLAPVDNPVLPYLDVLVAWSALERDGDAAAAEARAAELERHTEVRCLARLLAAEAARRLGRAGAAAAASREATAELERRSRTSFEAFAWLPLGRLVSAQCRLAVDPTDVDERGLSWVAERSPRTFVGRRAAAILSQHGQ